MTLHDIIFSNKQPERFLRHFAFWVAQSLFWVFWASFFFYRTWEWVRWGFGLHGYFILEIVYTYLLTYYLAPKFLYTKQYLKFASSVAFLTLLTYPLFLAIQFVVLDVAKESRDGQLLAAWFLTMNFLIAGPPVIFGMFLTVKMLKNYYLKMQEKATVIKESANAELQLLKSQIHPHFLFNTLNNIYSFNLDRSPVAADLVLKLSHTLKYMVNDCEAALVPLDKELKMLQDYIGLEKVRYGKRLKFSADITGDFKNKLIAPLLMIPFVENSFKHGASKMLEHPWIRMQIIVRENFLDFRISNSMPLISQSTRTNGIGLRNVKQRLELIYPNAHKLQIKADTATFSVELTMPVHIAESEKIVLTDQKSIRSESYAME